MAEELPSCGVCSQPVTPHQPAVLLNTSKCTVHTECMHCNECQCSLTGSTQTHIVTLKDFRAKGGDASHELLPSTQVVPLCKEHYQARCGTFCTTCQLLLEGSFFRVGETAAYHPHCLRCANCDASVNTKTTSPAKIHDNIVRCESCFDDMQYDKCVGCRQHIKAQFVRYGSSSSGGGSKEGMEGTKTEEEGKWHPECFCCILCEKSLSNIQFMDKKDGLFCESCYQQANAPRCLGCQHLILDKSFLQIEGASYHEQCVACSVCSLPARDKNTNQVSVHAQEGLFYCKPHYVELFAEKCAGCLFGIESVRNLCEDSGIYFVQPYFF